MNLHPNTTQVPNIIFDQLMPLLKESELKVLLYIVRRTFGFQKDGFDKIALSQFTDGIKKRDGEQLDYGCGVKKNSVVMALSSLIEMKVIEKIESSSGNYYKLCLEIETSPKLIPVLNSDTTSPKLGQQLVLNSDTQNKGKQSIQNKDISVTATSPKLVPVSYHKEIVSLIMTFYKDIAPASSSMKIRNKTERAYAEGLIKTYPSELIREAMEINKKLSTTDFNKCLTLSKLSDRFEVLVKTKQQPKFIDLTKKR